MAAQIDVPLADVVWTRKGVERFVKKVEELLSITGDGVRLPTELKLFVIEKKGFRFLCSAVVRIFKPDRAKPQDKADIKPDLSGVDLGDDMPKAGE